MAPFTRMPTLINNKFESYHKEITTTRNFDYMGHNEPANANWRKILIYQDLCRFEFLTVYNPRRPPRRATRGRQNDAALDGRAASAIGCLLGCHAMSRTTPSSRGDVLFHQPQEAAIIEGSPTVFSNQWTTAGRAIPTHSSRR